jgi:acyl-CoA synthetase (AMP-forming)/AMP-acid ligase II
LQGGQRKEQSVRYIIFIFGSAILAAVLVATIANGHVPRLATASNDETDRTVIVLKLEETIDAKALPRQEISDEVYQ